MDMTDFIPLHKSTPAFVLLFAAAFEQPVTAVPPLPADVAPLPDETVQQWVKSLAEFEARFLGPEYVKVGRICRMPVGRLISDQGGGTPSHADVHLLAHMSGIALLAVWLTAPEQDFDATRWIEWLNPESESSISARLWAVLQPLDRALGGSGDYAIFFPLCTLRAPDTPLDELVDAPGIDLVRLLYLDRSTRRLKPEVIAEKLERGYCAREGGLTQLARRRGLDLHGAEDVYEEISSDRPPKSALPFLITVEQLLIECTMLKRLHGRLSPSLPCAIHRLRGIVNLHETVMNRLEAASFAITTRYRQCMTLLQFWLTIVFGATEIGFIASGIATWHYRAELGGVGWTVGAAVESWGILVSLRGKVL